MEKYNYYEAVKADLISFINDNLNTLKDFDRAQAEEWVNEVAWTADSVTGNGSGSYTFNTWKAEEYICHNLDLFREALEEFGQPDDTDKLTDAEYIDVTIRCYLLGQLIGEALDASEWEEPTEE
jgi:hypothetical protein